MGFGDLSFRPISSSVGDFMTYFIRAKGARADGANAAYWRWWCEAWKMKMSDGGVIGFLYRTSLPELPPAKAPMELPQSKVFRGIGVAALNSSLLDANEAVQVLFKSSPFGTQSHGHNAHNSFQLSAYGEVLLPACTYRDLHGSKFHYQYVHSTASQNAVLVDGEGQIKHTAAPHGRIAAAQLTKEWDYVMGDATLAYGDRLNRYHRHVVMLKPDVIVIYDDLSAKQPSTFQFLLHAMKAFSVDEKAGKLAVTLPKAGLGAQYLSAQPLSFRQWDGFEPKPNKPFPNHWHVEAATTQKQAEIGMLTVLTPHKTGQQVTWSATRIESESAIGVRITRGGKTATITFRKGGANAAVADLVRVESFR
jgi:hypothetical protein